MNERTTGKSFKVFNKVDKFHKKFNRKEFKNREISITKKLEEKNKPLLKTIYDKVSRQFLNFFMGTPALKGISHKQVKTRTRNPKEKRNRKISRSSFIYNNTHRRGHART